MDNSNINVSPNGILVDISTKAEVPCPTCSGKGSIPDPACMGKVMGYCGRNGETVPHITCRTYMGQGWVIKTII